MIGQSIYHYGIEEKLGEVGMGIVYKVPNFPTSVVQRVVENLTPKAFGATLFVGTRDGGHL